MTSVLFMIDSFLIGSRLLRAAPPVVDEGVLGAGRRGGERRGRDRLELIVLQLDEAGRVARKLIELCGDEMGAIEGIFPGADDVDFFHVVYLHRLRYGQ